jgi:hypothetical protein
LGFTTSGFAIISACPCCLHPCSLHMVRRATEIGSPMTGYETSIVQRMRIVRVPDPGSKIRLALLKATAWRHVRDVRHKNEENPNNHCVRDQTKSRRCFIFIYGWQRPRDEPKTAGWTNCSAWIFATPATTRLGSHAEYPFAGSPSCAILDTNPRFSIQIAGLGLSLLEQVLCSCFGIAGPMFLLRY